MKTSFGVKKNLGTANVEFDGKELIVSTGLMSRTFEWTGKGFLTKAVAANDGKIWTLTAKNDYDADWLLPVCETRNSRAELVEASGIISDDEGFTSEHIAFVAEMIYPDEKLACRFSVWVFPGAPGLRMNLALKGMSGFMFNDALHKSETTEESLRSNRLSKGYNRHDILPVDPATVTRRMIGYHSDTQNRNDKFLDLLLERTDDVRLTHPYVCEWANAICLEDEHWGIAMLKESHKCVNQRGYDTGTFVCLPGQGVEDHGWGILPTAIDTEWRSGWASWCIVYKNDDRSRQDAFKTFDQFRYPLRENDIYIQANTWGSSQGYLEHRDAAGEKSVLREIESCADLGIDVLQIDDGWQGHQYETWIPVPERYPEGWKNVRKRAEESGVKLGLWMAATPPSLEDMKRNAAEGGFVSYKLDFAHLTSRQQIDSLMNKVRTFVKDHDHQVRVNWDLTEVAPRYGVYFAREFGCIYLENRKPVWPRSVTYRPGTVLKDLWELSHYCNLLKFQGSTQNIDMVDDCYSDVGAYNHAYCLAITLMSSPLFFCETKFYDDDARAQIRPLLAAYKKVRNDIYRGIIHPLGDRPDGTKWTGFECALPEANRAFYTIFREPWNQEAQHGIKMPQFTGNDVILKNLMTDDEWGGKVSSDGTLLIGIDDPADFRFLEVKSL